MKKEEFVALGIDEKLADKAAEESKKELSGYVPKTRFDEVNEAKKQLETSSNDYKIQLETLKTSAGDNETLKQQIADLQVQNQQKDAEYQKQLKDLQLTNAIKLAIADSAQDCDLVAGLVDKSKLILGDDGKVTGLDEQVKTLKESKAFLFKEAPKTQTQNPVPGFKVGSVVTPGQASVEGKVSMKDAIAAKLQSQMGQVKE